MAHPDIAAIRHQAAVALIVAAQTSRDAQNMKDALAAGHRLDAALVSSVQELRARNSDARVRDAAALALVLRG